MIDNTSAIHVLVVDDDDAIRDLLCDFLQNNNITAHEAASYAQIWQAIQQQVPDVIVLDINMPYRNGMEICREIRESAKYSHLPILMLTARTSSLDAIMGLEIGADDYVSKPFEPLELLSRIRSLVRRSKMQYETSPQQQETNSLRYITFNDWKLDIQHRSLIDTHQTAIALSNAEFKFIRFMLLNANRILSRDQLMEEIHGRESGPFDRSVDLQISRLRQKIELDSKNPTIIKTLRNEGYILSADVRYIK